MADLNYLAGEIEKGKNLEINLPKYFNELLSAYHQYSYIRFTLNYYTCCEQLLEAEHKTKSIEEMAGKADGFMKDIILKELKPENLENIVEQIDTIRNQIMEKMKILTIYTDAFQIYEYVLNRLEFSFDKEIQKKMKDFKYEEIEESFLKEVTAYIKAGRDNISINAKITQIIGQLPIRITKQRYFEIIRDSFSLYKGADKASMEDFIYMLRTCGMLDLEKIEKDEENSELSEILKTLENTEYKEISEEKFKKLQEILEAGNDILIERTNLCMMLEEIINDLYVIAMASPYVLTEEKEISICRQIIEKINILFGERKEAEENESSALDLYTQLEGKQERLYERITSAGYALDSLKQQGNLLQSLMLEKIYHILLRAEQLTSSSIFIELEKKIQSEKVEEEVLKETMDSFISQMTEQFKRHSKLVNRSIMASTLSMLPVFFNNMEEAEDYILHSLRNCSDKSELVASISLLSDIIEEEGYD